MGHTIGIIERELTIPAFTNISIYHISKHAHQGIINGKQDTSIDKRHIAPLLLPH